LRLRNAEDRQPVRIAGIIGRVESSVVLLPGLVPEASNPRASLRAAAIGSNPLEDANMINDLVPPTCGGVLEMCRP
jgi:hypothetical protein